MFEINITSTTIFHYKFQYLFYLNILAYKYFLFKFDSLARLS